MCARTLCTLIWLVAVTVINSQSNGIGPLVTLPNGNQLKGKFVRSLGGRVANSFTKIPYGKAQRFNAPVLASKWQGVLDATTPSPLCMQYNRFFYADSPVIGVEDCLNLDIVTPLVITAGKNCPYLMPVVILLAEVGWSTLGSSYYGAEYLMDHDVVLMTINSRTGIFGFLSTRDNVITGNFGLKDQLLAIQWAHNNIVSFCGDPSRVTLIGESTGATSAFLHSLNPASKGLIHRIIALSGSANNFWVLPAEPKLKTRWLGSLFGCNLKSPFTVLRCLQGKDAKDIVAKYSSFKIFDIYAFGPVIEKYTKGAFLTQDPLKIIQSGKFESIPVIMSSVKGEGLIPGGLFLAKPQRLAHLNRNFNEIAPVMLDYDYTVSNEQRDTVTNDIKAHYFGEEDISVDTLPQLIKLLSDRLYLADNAYAAIQLACVSKEPVYYSTFNYFSSASVASVYYGVSSQQLEPFGPGRGDDVRYIFNVSYLSQPQTRNDLAVVKAMTKMVAGFAETGEADFGPNEIWLPICLETCNATKINLLQINSASEYKMDTATNLGDFEFWNNLPLSEPGTPRTATNTNANNS